MGRRLANRERNKRKIGAIEGVPAMDLDGLGSSAYGPEAALAILAPAGALGPQAPGGKPPRPATGRGALQAA
jgi:hypothetical protein